MKIENEVTGEISERLNNIIRVDIYLRGEKIETEIKKIMGVI